jgi:hypothetical protein
VDPRAGLDDLEKRKCFTLPGLELRPLCCPARSSRSADYAVPAPDLGVGRRIILKFGLKDMR